MKVGDEKREKRRLSVIRGDESQPGPNMAFLQINRFRCILKTKIT